MTDASLYFHIPFCTKKCPYCHFYVVPNRKELHTLLAEALRLEWELKRPPPSTRIVSIYFGGGTPSLFAPDGIAQILSLIDFSPDCEITLEANPEESSPELFRSIRALGVNRLSIGVQSLDDNSLQTLGRLHSAQKAKQAIHDAASAGFDNISIDLMYDLPDQTEKSWISTLRALADLPISHLSLYNLTIEPHTAFFKIKDALKTRTPTPETSLRLLELALDHFDQLGLSRYEISAFAKNNQRSIHNSGYWTGRPFLGFGPSAFSYWNSRRFQNEPNLQRYRRALLNNQDPTHFNEQLDPDAQIRERLAIQLRLLEGVDTKNWNLPAETIAALHTLQERGWLEQTETRWRLTKQGTLFYDSVAEELI